ncbi:ribonuclease R [Cohnella faecalis]|uniref:ribonuclease R n=1 Tax=Cohnella faecalis TaxID=2315694 RepID=UPI0018F37AFF|nr:ribonuclease R [Cohnella faecalis]
MCTEQELLDFMRETAYKPMTYQELEKHFGIANAEEFKAFLRMLTEMENEGKILLTRTDRYGVPERMNLLRGRLQAHPKGFAFLLPEEPDHPDVYIHANDLQSAMNGDTVLVRVTSKSDNGSRLEGEVVRVVKRAVTQVVGLFTSHDSFGFVVPDDKRINKDIFIRQESFLGAASGQKVVVKIVKYPEGRSAAEGEIVEILGNKDEPGVDILSIIRKHGLPEGFPEEVLAEAEAAPEVITEDEIVSQGRRDLRNKVIVTIDGEDAKDLDDAVNVEVLENGNWLLGVHIADVSYYVREKSKLDEEAYNRGTSVYLVDRVIPMLPHRLSNGICSLNPKVDRLTMSCEMEFDPRTMRRVRHDIFTSVIRTKERMTYTNVRKIVQDEDPEVSERYADLVDTFKLMRDLAMELRGQRMKRGAIDFDFQESKVLVDEQGKPYEIIKRERSIAEQIIEEFMLAANETVAEHFHWLKVPFLYRIHEEPEGDKLVHFMQFAGNFGYAVRGKGNSVHPRALQTLLEEIRGKKEETVISTMMLRSMKQAKYDAQSLGHFGLAAEFYSHFTSPIRRYPDLMIHRVMREVIENGGALPEGRFDVLNAKMPEVAQQSSERERTAVDAERDTEKLKKAEFMLDKIGEEFEGMVSGVTSFGMFIELENTVEGLIRLSDMTDDYYHFHELHMALIGERTSKIYRIGDEVKIRVARVSMDDHTIDFELVDMKPRSYGGGRVNFVDSRGGGAGFGGKRKKRGSGGSGGGFGAVAGRGGGQGDRRGKGKAQPGGGKGKSERGSFGGAGSPGAKKGGRGAPGGTGDSGGHNGERESLGRVGVQGDQGGLGGFNGNEGGSGGKNVARKRGGEAGDGAVRGDIAQTSSAKREGVVAVAETAVAGVALQSGGKKRKGGSGSEPAAFDPNAPRGGRGGKKGRDQRGGRPPMDQTPDVNSVSGPRVKRKKGTDMWGLPISGTLSRATDDGEGGIIGEPRKKKGPGGRPEGKGNRAGGGRRSTDAGAGATESPAPASPSGETAPPKRKKKKQQ